MVFWALDRLGVQVRLANIIGFTAGGINSYLWNKSWNFKSTGSHRSEAPRFLLAFLLGYALNYAVLEFLLHFPAFPLWIESLFSTWPKLGISASFISNTIANAVYVLASFTLIKWFVFAPKSTSTEINSNR